MRDRERHIRLRIDGYTRFCLTAIVVLMSVLIVGLWAEGIPAPGRAGAAVQPASPPQERYQPRSAIDISELVAVGEKTNAKLDEIKQLLESGRVKVQVVGESARNSGGGTNVQPTTSDSGSGGIRPGVHAN